MTTTQRNFSTSVAQSPDLVPIRIIEIELGQPLPVISAFDEKTSCYYKRALCVVRLHTQPLDLVELQLNEHDLYPSAYQQQIWNDLHKQINEHLEQDGLPVVSELGAKGLPCSTTPQCIQEREHFLVDAPFVSVIVATHDRPELLQICLRSLLALHYPRYEVIIVDNAPSTSATADLVERIYGNVEQVRYLREDHPGHSWACNRGIMAARGEILAVTDDDVVPDPYWLVELVRAFHRSDNVACVTGLVLPLELEVPAQFWFEQYGGFNRGFRRCIFDLADHRLKTPLYPYTAGRFGTGASMAFTAMYLRSVGGFDPALAGSGPVKVGMDIAAFFQVIIQGYQLVYEPLSLTYHLHRRNYTELRKQLYNYGLGTTASLTKSLCEHPYLLLDLITKLPYGFFFALSSHSAKNNKRQANYPKELKTLELKGMIYGPLAYLRSKSIMHKAGRNRLSHSTYSESR